MFARLDTIDIHAALLVTMSIQTATENMDRSLSTFLEGSYEEEDGQAMLKELVHCRTIRCWNIILNTIQVKYRAQVIAQTAGKTPLIRHAFQVLQAWHQAQLGDPIPWEHIKNRTMYVPPAPSSVPPTGPPLVEIHSAPPPPSTKIAPDAGIERHSTPAGAGDTLALGTSTPLTTVPILSGQVGMIIVDSEQVTRLNKGKGRERDEPVMEALATPPQGIAEACTGHGNRGWVDTAPTKKSQGQEYTSENDPNIWYCPQGSALDDTG
jgi:hypothetical protein